MIGAMEKSKQDRRIEARRRAAGKNYQMRDIGEGFVSPSIDAIGQARRSVALSSYIFRDDTYGQQFSEALIRALKRGVEVRVLIDGVGSGWFWSGTYVRLKRAGVPVKRFLHSYFPWRTPFLNLRNHRKILVVDGRLAFVGGLNIGDENVEAGNPQHPVRDTHFRIEGPVVAQLVEAFADDWLFQTGERLLSEIWFPPIEPAGTIPTRAVSSGPDEELEQIEFVALHAISCARRSIRVVTPYFLPPEVLTASMRAHQKYFSLLADDGKLAPRFVVIANNAADDGGKAIIAGNERVLRARLSDAKFFWDQDRKTKLEERVPALASRVFHAKLGSVHDKIGRVAKLARTRASGSGPACGASGSGLARSASGSTSGTGEGPPFEIFL